MKNTIKTAGKSALSILNLFYGGMGLIIMLIIFCVFPPLGILIVGSFLYYIYKCLKK